MRGPERTTGRGVDLVDRTGHRWATLSWSRAASWTSTLIPLLVAIAVLAVVAPAAPLWPALPLLVLAAGSCLAPDSALGLVTIVGYVAWWFAAADAVVTGWTALAALCLLGFHLSVALAAAGPAGTEVAGAVRLRLWRGALVPIAVTAGVVLAVTTLDTGRAEAGPTAVAATVLAIGLLPWLAGRR